MTVLPTAIQLGTAGPTASGHHRRDRSLLQNRDRQHNRAPPPFVALSPVSLSHLLSSPGWHQMLTSRRAAGQDAVALNKLIGLAQYPTVPDDDTATLQESLPSLDVLLSHLEWQGDHGDNA